MSNIDSKVFSDVTGETYRNAELEMKLIDGAVESRLGQVFSSYDECDSFAHEHNLDLFVYQSSSNSFSRLDHRGGYLTHNEWKQQYKNILQYEERTGDKAKVYRWEPDSYKARIGAGVRGEKAIGTRRPVNERNFFVPTGYRNPNTGRFNSAMPFRYWARETGADTSFIYEWINHIAGDNALYLLAWLRKKMCNPTQKTEVMPIFIGEQGSGKTVFANFLCRAMFGVENVVVDVNFNGASRFNSDFVDSLVVCIEEKTIDDNKNLLPVLKSLVTSTTIRNEKKGVDAFMQDNFMELILTTNEMVPMKFDSQRQRRFMVMETDPSFVRVKEGEKETDVNRLADEVFEKITGMKRGGVKTGESIVDNKPVMEQFKWELLTDPQLQNVDPRDFVETDAFKRCFSVPRTVEMIEIESIIRACAPFIRESLMRGAIVTDIADNDKGILHRFSEVCESTDCMAFVRRHMNNPNRVALNRMLLFRDKRDNVYSHASIDRCIKDNAEWLRREYGLVALATSDPPDSGFTKVTAKYRYSPAVWFIMDIEYMAKQYDRVLPKTTKLVKETNAIGVRRRYGSRYQEDPNGMLEVLNPLYDGKSRSQYNVTSLNTFLLEADWASKEVKEIENTRLKSTIGTIKAEELYKERLEVQRLEAKRLINDGIAWRAVYSGQKSIHILITVKIPPLTIDERRWLDAYLKMTVSQRLVFDMQTADAARLTRAPVVYERTELKELDGQSYKVTGTQCLIAERPENVYELDWRPLYNQWKHLKHTAYEVGPKRMLPTKGIYKEALKALMDGTFWTADTWNGQRNELFFVGYRLMRAQGLSREDIWATLKEDAKAYKKKNEYNYWITREHCDLIKSIDAEFDE